MILECKERKYVTAFGFSPSICHEVIGTECRVLSFGKPRFQEGQCLARGHRVSERWVLIPGCVTALPSPTGDSPCFLAWHPSSLGSGPSFLCSFLSTPHYLPSVSLFLKVQWLFSAPCLSPDAPTARFPDGLLPSFSIPPIVPVIGAWHSPFSLLLSWLPCGPFCSVIQGPDSEAKLPGFKSWLSHQLAEWC